MEIQQLNIDELATKIIDKLGGSLPEVTLQIFIDEYIHLLKETEHPRHLKG